MLSVCALLFLVSTPCWAAGLWLYETASPNTGTAGAGRAALAKDASTAAFNPAGMTKLERSQALPGFQTIIVNTKFDQAGGTSVTGGAPKWRVFFLFPVYTRGFLRRRVTFPELTISQEKVDHALI